MKLKLLLSLMVTILFGYLVIRNVDLKIMLEVFQKTNFVFIVIAALISISTFLIRTLRWKVLLNFSERYNYGDLFKVNTIGYFANNVLPARAGEVVRSVLLAKKKKLAISFVLSTILVERVIDGLTLVFFLAIFSLSPIFPKWVGNLGFTTGLLFLFTTISLFLISAYYLRLKPWILLKMSGLKLSQTKQYQKILAIVDSIIEGLNIFKSAKAFLNVVSLSIIIWLIESTVYWLVGLGFQLNVPFYGYILLVAVVNLGTLIPAAPGYVGTYEYLVVLVLGLFNIVNSEGLSIALIMHATQFIPITILGFIFFVNENLSFPKINKNLETDIKILYK